MQYIIHLYKTIYKLLFIIYIYKVPMTQERDGFK